MSELATVTVMSCRLVGVEALRVDVCCRAEVGASDVRIAGATALAAKEAKMRLLSATSTVGESVSCVSISLGTVGAPTRATASLDLACALGALAASGGLPASSVADVLVVGELGLDGSVRPVRGTLAAAELARSEGARAIIVPESCAWEAALVPGLVVHPVTDLAEAMSGLRGERPLRVLGDGSPSPLVDDDAAVLARLCGIPVVAAAVAAVADAVARGQGVLLVGSPGVGKTMLARRVRTLMPALTHREALDVTRAYSALGLARELPRARPFRAPHYTVSAPALVGGADGRPGEVGLASCGVLYLDELDQFNSSTVLALAAALRRTPAGRRPVVVASASPCPCGWSGSDRRSCTCSAEGLERHQGRVRELADTLGPLARVEVPAISISELRRSGDDAERV